MLSENIQITKIEPLAAAGTSALVSTVIDMQGWDGVIILGQISVANAGNYLSVAQDIAVGMGTGADLLGSKVICTASLQVIGIDIYRPRERYLQSTITRTASTATGVFYAIQYRGKKSPTTIARTGYAFERHVSPAEGTA